MPLVIRLGGLSVYGASVIWPNALSFVFALSYFGVGYNYRRQLATADSIAERRKLFEPQLSYQFTTLIAICVLGAIVGSFGGGGFFDGNIRVSVWVLIFWLAVQFIFFQTQEYFRNTLRFDQFNFINILANVCAVSSIFAWGLLGGPVTLTSLLMLTTVTRLLATTPWLIILLLELGLPRFRLPFGELWSDMKVGWPLFLDFTFTALLGFGDRYLIAIFLGIAAVGRYQPGYQLAYLLVFIPRCTEMLLAPTLARMVDTGDKKGAERLTSGFLNFFFMVAVPYAVGALFVGPSIIAWLSNVETAEATVWVTALVVLGTAMYGVTLICYQAAYTLRRLRFVLRANFLGAGLNIALNIVLLSIFRNLTAAAVASLISYGVTALYIVWAIRPEWRLHPDWTNFVRFVVSAAAMGCALWSFGFWPLTISRMQLSNILGAVFAAATIYFAVLWVVGGFGTNVLQILRVSRGRYEELSNVD